MCSQNTGKLRHEEGGRTFYNVKCAFASEVHVPYIQAWENTLSITKSNLYHGLLFPSVEEIFKVDSRWVQSGLHHLQREIFLPLPHAPGASECWGADRGAGPRGWPSGCHLLTVHTAPSCGLHSLVWVSAVVFLLGNVCLHIWPPNRTSTANPPQHHLLLAESSLRAGQLCQRPPGSFSEPGKLGVPTLAFGVHRNLARLPEAIPGPQIVSMSTKTRTACQELSRKAPERMSLDQLLEHPQAAGHPNLWKEIKALGGGGGVTSSCKRGDAAEVLIS